MTTPTDPFDGIALPFSVVWSPQVGDTRLFVHPDMQNSSVSRTRLTELAPGVAIISVTWDGPEPLLLQHRKVVPTQIGASVGRIPAGEPGIYRTIPAVQVASKIISWISLDLTSPASEETVEMGYTAGLTVYPVSTYRQP